MKFSYQPFQDWSKPNDAQVKEVADQEDRIFLDSLQEFEEMQRRNMQRFARMVESDPKLRAQMEQARRHDHRQKFGPMDFSKIEARVADTFAHSSGVVRGVVQRYPRMSDNLPRDVLIKADVAPGKRMLQTDIHLGDVKTDDLSMAMITAAFALSGEQLGVIPAPGGGQFVEPETHLPLHYLHSDTGPIVDFKTSGDPKGPQPTGRALRVSRGSDWSAERRDRAATSASDRKKLRAKTRAQKKARRKQR
ncbi:hypothetical protein MPK71_gp037 [Erwinia phage pEa_SNUABM_1]|uniref:Uncharacterized protein n=1 Tax=Erwinia phage pEa_SNUABM_1 TaxID=2869543 RepID=A0AAE7XJ73_9CAUD|nr:hypothetical protein MPK71_gp037 [Erwinia phage pEa_SNUABM_1]QZE57246.1 hypothetical protein pEaSNUABM1_00037 [Erwinia phage pEa_SNUABM_1]